MLNRPQLGSSPHRLQGLSGHFRVLKRFNPLGGVFLSQSQATGKYLGLEKAAWITRCFPQGHQVLPPDWGGGLNRGVGVILALAGRIQRLF